MSTPRVFERTYHPDERGSFVWKLNGPAGVIVLQAGPASPTSHEINKRYPEISVFDSTGWSWTCWDLGAHSRVARSVGDTALAKSCEYLGGAACYYDGSGLQAQTVIKAWIAAGESDMVIEQQLHGYYDAWLGDDLDRSAAYLLPLERMLGAKS